VKAYEQTIDVQSAMTRIGIFSSVFIDTMLLKGGLKA
jgi:hypothetical protein